MCMGERRLIPCTEEKFIVFKTMNLTNYKNRDTACP